MDKEYLMGQCSDNYLMHYGRKGQKRGEHQYGKWQSHAVYAQGKPNPNAKVRGKKEDRKLAGADYDGDTVYKAPNGKSVRYPGGWAPQSAYKKSGRSNTIGDIRRANVAKNAKDQLAKKRDSELAKKANALDKAIKKGDKQAANSAASEVSRRLSKTQKAERQAARADAKARAKAEARAEANRKHLPGYQSKVERKAERDARLSKARSRVDADFKKFQASDKSRVKAEKAFNDAKNKLKLQKQNYKALRKQLKRELSATKSRKSIATDKWNQAYDDWNLSEYTLNLLKVFG